MGSTYWLYSRERNTEIDSRIESVCLFVFDYLTKCGALVEFGGDQ